MPTHLARLKSLFLVLGASTMVWVLVRLCTVVMQPCTMPNFSWMTLTTGARQLVVQDAAVTMWSVAGSYLFCGQNNRDALLASEVCGALHIARNFCNCRGSSR